MSATTDNAPESFRTTIVRAPGVEWESVEAALDASGRPLPLPSRNAWASLMPGAEYWLVVASDQSGHPMAAFATERIRSRALPGHVIARVDRLGSSALTPGGIAALVALTELARADSRTLEVQIELALRTESAHAQAATVLQALGYRRRSTPRNYRETLVVDLVGTIDDVFAGLSTKTRRDIRQSEKQPVDVRLISDTRYAARLQLLAEETMARTGGIPVPRPWAERILLSNALPTKSRLVGLFRHGRDDDEALLAFAWGCAHGEFAHYDAAGSTRAADIKVSLNYPLLWDLVKWAHEHGAQWFDLGGVTTGTRESGDPLGGISDFKRWFSKTLVPIGEDWIFSPHPGRTAVATVIRRASTWIGRRA